MKRIMYTHKAIVLRGLDSLFISVILLIKVSSLMKGTHRDPAWPQGPVCTGLERQTGRRRARWQEEGLSPVFPSRHLARGWNSCFLSANSRPHYSSAG
jgi:hypothetical protein